MEEKKDPMPSALTETVTITEIIDDLRSAEEIVRRFERRYWLSSADFYELYKQGQFDDGENSEDFALWAGFYAIKVEREVSLQSLSQDRVRQLRALSTNGGLQIQPIEPTVVAA